MVKNAQIVFIASSLLSSILFASVALADDTNTTPATGKLPLEEKAFVDAINKFDKAKIIAQLGKPAKEDDVKMKDSGKVVASIWQYHNLNKAADGTTYQTTELDFVDDQVVQVVFLNNDGSESDNNNGQSYEVAPPSPDEMPQGYTPMNPPAGM
jgi:hypothetical protein